MAQASPEDPPEGQALAHVCMTVIGIGYLFPISAIWAAFDYWKELFPGSNIEFAVTGVYQVGSVLTVAALSLVQTVALGPRIQGGFAGQFACLAVIFAFRWLALPQAALLEVLLVVVALCSVATGFLDSALLALCSQYSPKMQRYLQIGIGFGTLVSVLYRDATKLVMRDIAEATSLYFLVALATVVVCVVCYRVLMSLPVSRCVTAGDSAAGAAAHLPTLNSPTLNAGPVSPQASRGHQLGDALGKGDAAAVLLDEGSQASFPAVLGIVWRNQAVIFVNFFITTLCYPGLITSVPCRQFVALRHEHWFQTLLLTAFSLADIVGRFMTHIRFGLYHGNIGVTVVVRAALFPLMMFCIRSDLATDEISMLVVSAFGFLNGYCVSLALIVVNDIPKMTPEQRKTSGRISACSVNGGLCLGSLVASALAATLRLGA